MVECLCGKCICPEVMKRNHEHKRLVDEYFQKLEKLLKQAPDGKLENTLYTENKSAPIKVQNLKIYERLKAPGDEYDSTWNSYTGNTWVSKDWFNETTTNFIIENKTITITSETKGTESSKWSHKYELKFIVS